MTAPGWPGDPNTVEMANRHPRCPWHKTVGQIVGHFGDLISELKKKLVSIGCSFGGLLTQILAGRGAGAVWVPWLILLRVLELLAGLWHNLPYEEF